MRAPFLIVTAVAALAALPCLAAEPRLAVPLDCAIGEDCWVVGTMDHGVGTDILDYACGRRSRNGQTATEFALSDMAAVARGVPVLAMAAGRVTSVRDGMPDGGYLQDKGSVKDRECGNGVVLDHGGGWQTQYCHLRKDSVTVRDGQTVMPRQQLGMAGMSGRADIPLLSVDVRQARRPVDPFLGLGGMTACGPGPGQMWAEDVRAALSYRGADIAIAAFSDTRPTELAVTFGAAGKASLTADAPAMLLWTRVFGTRQGDELILRIVGPDGQPFAQDVARIAQDHRAYTRFAGVDRRISRWPPGRYSGDVILRRVDANGHMSEWKRTATVSIP